jgi:ABC-type nickel/cobalt efflux system permease component RcnA
MKKRSLLFSLILLLIVVRVAWAHPADMYFHTYLVSLSQDSIQITWEIVPGPMLAQMIWHSADQDQDDAVSDQEARVWAQTVIPSFSVDLDGTILTLDLQAVEWPSGVPELITGEQPVRIHLQSDWSIAIDRIHRLTLQNRLNDKNSVCWFDVQGLDGIRLDVPEQRGGTLSLCFERSTAEQSAARLTTWESGRPSVPWMVESLGLGDFAGRSQTQSGAVSILEGLVTAERTSPVFILAAMVIGIMLGALHAISPGHGKTIVAAYLVGSQGKFHHAIALGSIVTLTHTGSVFALGLLTLTASRYLVTVDVLPILECVSGLMIFFLGVGLLTSRLRGYLVDRRRRRQREDSRSIVVREAGKGARLIINQAIDESGPPHSHDPSEFGYVPRGPAEGNPLARIRWRSLVTLGISGGIVPCPDAIAILMIAVTINRIAFGLSLIVAFSVGLAFVLIVIGLLIIQGKRLFERLRWFDRVAHATSVLSALVVLGLGATLTVGAIPGLSGESDEVGSALQATQRRSFDLQQANVIYTALDENNKHQFFIVPASGGQPEQITEGAEDIWNYAISPDRSLIVYAAPNGMNGTRLWQLDPATTAQTLLLDCPEAYCSGVVWSPDGLRVLYGRLESSAESNPIGIPSIWWLDLTTYETAPLFQDAQMPGYNPRWSPDGKWLSYTSINPQEIQIYNMETDASQSLPTQTAHPAAWSPNGETLLLVDTRKVGELYLLKLFRYDLADQELTALDIDRALDESYPTWSPDGKWIAVVRREWGVDTQVYGDQIWLMRPDGSEAHPVTRTQDVFHGQPVWSPNGRYLLYDVRSASSSDVHYGVNILDIETGDTHEIAAPGNRPTWLP